MALANGLRICCFIVFPAVFLMATRSADAQSWLLSQQFDSGCLFVDDSSFAGQPKASLLPDTNATAVQKLADQIALGLAQSVHANGSVIINPRASVDLNVIVSNAVDEYLLEPEAPRLSDPYWTYYHHCDAWNVAFNKPGQQKIQLLDQCMSARKNWSQSLCAGLDWLLDKHSDWVSAYRQAAFHAVENFDVSVMSSNSENEDMDSLTTISLVTQLDCMLRMYKHPVLDLIRNLRATAVAKVRQLQDLNKIFTKLTVPFGAGLN